MILTCGKGTLGCGLLCSKAATSDTSLSTESSVNSTDDINDESSNCILSMYNNMSLVCVCNYVTMCVNVAVIMCKVYIHTVDYTSNPT